MNSKLMPGLSATVSHRVEENFLASEVGSGLVSVFSTAMMIAFLEEAAVACVQPFLPEGFTTVGTHIDVEHKAATPFGMMVSFEAVLAEVTPNGKGLKFNVTARDEVEVIGSGIHYRVVVNQEDFEKRTHAKTGTRQK